MPSFFFWSSSEIIASIYLIIYYAYCIPRIFLLLNWLTLSKNGKLGSIESMSLSYSKPFKNKLYGLFLNQTCEEII